MKRIKDYFSFSQIKSYLTCPLQYKYKYIDGIEAVPTGIMLAGSKAHENMANILKEKKIDKLPEKIRPIIEKYFYDSEELHIEETINTEIFITNVKLIPDVYSIKNNTIYLIDWKKNSLPESDMQLKWYAVNLKNVYPQIENFVCWYFALESNFFKRYYYIKEDLDEYENFLLELIEQIEEEKEFKPIIGSHCGYCPYVQKCLDNNKVNIEAINNIIIKNDEEFKKIAEKVLLYEAVISKVKEVMKEYMLNTGKDEIQINENDKFYLSYTISLRTGKIKNGRRKKSN